MQIARILQRWCQSFFEGGFHVQVTTNNGVESLNHSLKAFHLRLRSLGSLSSMLEVLTQDFVSSQMQRYARENWKQSVNNKAYNATIPQFLHNKPTKVIKHIITRMENAKSYKKEDVQRLSQHSFKVQSESGKLGHLYQVSFGSPDQAPKCECKDWEMSFLPCKHFFAAMAFFDVTWYDLPTSYRESPYMTLQPHWLTNPNNQSVNSHDKKQSMDSHDKQPVGGSCPDASSSKHSTSCQESPPQQQVDECDGLCPQTTSPTNQTVTIRRKLQESIKQ